MVKPKGAISNPWSGEGDYAQLMNGVKLPGEDPKEAEYKKKDQDRVNAMLKAQNGDVPTPPKTPEPTVEEVVAEAIENDTKFDPEVKKEMLDIVIENKLQIDEVTDSKIVFTKDDQKFVIVPV